MSALLFIQEQRKVLEQIRLINTLRLALGGGKDSDKKIERWARQAEIEFGPEE